MVWAHSNEISDGKGRGLKADDIFGCYACQHCHDIYDGRVYRNWQPLYITDAFTRAMKESWRRLIIRGILK